MKNLGKNLVFRVKIGVAIAVLFLAVATFLAANSLNEINVKDAKEGNIDVEFKDADIQDVFRVLALKGNVSIVADPEVKGLVTVQISDVPWEKALDVICRTYGYAYERENNIIRVTTLDKLGQENLVTEVFTLNYAKAADVAASVEEMKSERGKIKSDSRANLIIVTDIPTNIYKIGKVIKRLDAMTPQVTIEAKVIETTVSNLEDIGFKWNASYTANMASRPTTFPWPANNIGTQYNNFLPKGKTAADFPTLSQPAMPLASASDFSFGILDGSSFSLLLEAIQTKGKTKILSNPRITTLDNEPAEIHVGTDWPVASYSFSEESNRFVISGWEYKSYGILLKVTPTINQNGFVTLKLHPEISDKQEEIEFEGARVPVLTTQSADATVMIRDGQTLVIGGLIKDKNVVTKTKVPFLGDIPFLGLLFTHKSEEIVRNDLLIFITPHIITEQKLEKRQKISRILDESVTSNISEIADIDTESIDQAMADAEKAVVSDDDEELTENTDEDQLVTDDDFDAVQIIEEITEDTDLDFPEVPEAPEIEEKAENKPKVQAPDIVKEAPSLPVQEETVKENKGFFFKRK
ncbi:MAG: type IV pilus secretin PilQ [Candidatus Omnitrophota bacterium]